MYLSIFWLLVAPVSYFMLTAQYKDEAGELTERVDHLKNEHEWVRIVDYISIGYIYIDLFVKLMAYKRMVWFPALHREVISTYVLAFCIIGITVQTKVHGDSLSITYPKEAVYETARTPILRAFLILARSNSIQHDLLSKFYR